MTPLLFLPADHSLLRKQTHLGLVSNIVAFTAVQSLFGNVLACYLWILTCLYCRTRFSVLLQMSNNRYFFRNKGVLQDHNDRYITFPHGSFWLANQLLANVCRGTGIRVFVVREMGFTALSKTSFFFFFGSRRPLKWSKTWVHEKEAPDCSSTELRLLLRGLNEIWIVQPRS